MSKSRGDSKYMKPKIAVLGFSDGEPEVSEQLKDIVQAQVDAIVNALERSGEVEVVRGTRLIDSSESAKNEALRTIAEDVDGTIFSYGVFSFPNFSAIAAKNGRGPFLLAANLNPDWPGMVAMLASGGALHHLGIEHFRMDVSPDCDCTDSNDLSLVPNIGIAASFDPVALDRLCVDLVNKAPLIKGSVLDDMGYKEGMDKFGHLHSGTNWKKWLEYAEKIGLGTQEYELIEVK